MSKSNASPDFTVEPSSSIGAHPPQGADPNWTADPSMSLTPPAGSKIHDCMGESPKGRLFDSNAQPLSGWFDLTLDGSNEVGQTSVWRASVNDLASEPVLIKVKARNLTAELDRNFP